MPITAKFDPIDRDVRAMLAADLSPAAQSAAFAEFSREQLAAAEATNARALGAVPLHDTFVDGRAGAALESVKPDGVIVFEFKLIDDVLAWIGEELVRHSPVRSGRYAASHELLADGVAVEPGAPLPQASAYVFVNTQPYARKIERGLSPQAPDGVYQAVAAIAASRFGNIARVKFSYASPLFGSIHAWAGSTSMKSPGRRGAKREDWLRKQPAVMVSPY